MRVLLALVAGIGERLFVILRLLITFLALIGEVIDLVQRAKRRKGEDGEDGGGNEKARDATNRDDKAKVVNCPRCKSANRIGNGSGTPKCGACRAPLESKP